MTENNKTTDKLQVATTTQTSPPAAATPAIKSSNQQVKPGEPKKLLPPKTVASAAPVKQTDNKEKKLVGFAAHPENINRNGRPPKGWAWSDLLDSIGEEIPPGEDGKIDPNGKTYKEIVGRKLWDECKNGNIHAMRELFNRMEGLPRIKMDIDSKVKMETPQVADVFGQIYGLLHASNPDRKKDS